MIGLVTMLHVLIFTPHFWSGQTSIHTVSSVRKVGKPADPVTLTVIGLRVLEVHGQRLWGRTTKPDTSGSATDWLHSRQRTENVRGCP